MIGGRFVHQTSKLAHARNGLSLKAKNDIIFAQAGFFGRTVFQDFGDADAAHLAHAVTRHVFFADVFSADAEKRTVANEE